MFHDANAFESALETLVAVTEKSGNLRGDLRKDILTSVSILRCTFSKLSNLLEEKDKTIVKLTEDVSKQGIESAVQPAPSGGANIKLYSEVVRNKFHDNNRKTYKIFIKSKHNESADVVKTKIKSAINPVQMKLGISSFKSFRDGRIMIESEKKDEIDCISQNINTACKDSLEVSVPRLRNPQIVIYNIPEDVTTENIVGIITQQNPELNLNDGYLKPKFVFKNRKSCVNLVMEVNSEIRKRLLQTKLKLGWHFCNVNDYLAVTRCFKCNKFNHTAQACRGTDTCPLCAGSHKLKECKTSPENFKCSNCINFNKYTKTTKFIDNHSSLDKNCPCLQAMLKKYQQNTDY